MQANAANNKFKTAIMNNHSFKNNIIIKKLGENKMTKWRCTICDYIYDPTVGDPDGGIAPGTPFEKIPEDWVCPACGVGKDSFEKVS